MLADIAASVLHNTLSELAEYAVFCLVPKHLVVRKGDIPQEINSSRNIANGYLLGVKRELQPFSEESLDWIEQALQILLVGRHNYKVVGVACVISNLHLMLNELVEFVHVDVGEELGSEITDRQTVPIKKACASDFETPNNLLKQPHRIWVGDPTLENC